MKAAESTAKVEKTLEQDLGRGFQITSDDKNGVEIIEDEASLGIVIADVCFPHSLAKLGDIIFSQC